MNVDFMLACWNAEIKRASIRTPVLCRIHVISVPSSKKFCRIHELLPGGRGRCHAVRELRTQHIILCIFSNLSISYFAVFNGHHLTPSSSGLSRHVGTMLLSCSAAFSFFSSFTSCKLATPGRSLDCLCINWICIHDRM